jgi:hypothetical protein
LWGKALRREGPPEENRVEIGPGFAEANPAAGIDKLPRRSGAEDVFGSWREVRASVRAEKQGDAAVAP